MLRNKIRITFVYPSASVEPAGIFSQFNERHSGNLLDNNAGTVFAYTHWNSSSSAAATRVTNPSGKAGNAYVTLNQRLATRSGPGTVYDELGSYYSAGTEICAISKAWDSRNEIWWVQVEFVYNGTARRAYTGLKRLNMNAGQVPTEYIRYSDVRVKKTCIASWGPGESYEQHDDPVPKNTLGDVRGMERDYAQFEYYDGSTYRRMWIPVEYLDI